MSKSSGKNHESALCLTPMTGYLEVAIRWFFASQMVFWGLNGFYHWIKLKPDSEVIDNFINACIQTKFIMPTVKFIEVFFGLLLLFDFMTSGSLLVFAPVMFVITMLHVLFNQKPWQVLASYTIPYIILLIFHKDTLLRLFH